MQSNAARIGVLAAVVAAAVVLFIVLGGDDGDGGDGTTTTTATATTATATGTTDSSAPQLIVVKDGEPVDEVRTLTYERGDPVNIEVQLDPPEEEIHVHGYEITEPAEKSPVRLSFKADIDGLFEIEVHRTDGTDELIAELRVNP